MIKTISISEVHEVADNFMTEINNSLENKPSSLAFIRNPLPAAPLVTHEPYQAMVMGGTVFEYALVKPSKNQYHLTDFHKSELPSITHASIFEELFLKHLHPDVTAVGLSFAYPLDPVNVNGKLDGKLIRHTKEHTFEGLIGHQIGVHLEEYIYNKTGRKITVSVANDTVCLVLAGKTIASPDMVVGGIVGTGLNFGFFLDDTTIINLESGNFDRFSQSDAGRDVDLHSQNPGEHLFEKEVSGGYLYKLFSYYMPSHPISSSNELSILSALDGDEGRLAREIMDRSSALVATQMAGIYRFKKQKKLYFVMEGTLFWEGYDYVSSVGHYLAKLGIQKHQIEFIKIEKSSLKGAAYLINSVGKIT